mmetsp:Transcript_16475/g.35782  ORF Transcript_16475/g.35782 Transcript_16475/m.35782 type:complete len:257 (-) Transcript_16475:162-932(-)
MMMELVALPGSPWSNRAVWSFSVCGVKTLALTKYKPMLSEPWLRWRLKNFNPFTVVTVPVLFDESGKAIQGAENIARHGDRIQQENSETDRKATSLFPVQYEADIAYWIHCSDTLQKCLRWKYTDILKSNTELALSQIPSSIRERSPLLASVLAKVGIRFFELKYAAADRNAASESDACAILHSMHRSLCSSTKRVFLCGDSITFADIAVASAIGSLTRLLRVGDECGDQVFSELDRNIVSDLTKATTHSFMTGQW